MIGLRLERNSVAWWSSGDHTTNCAPSPGPSATTCLLVNTIRDLNPCPLRDFVFSRFIEPFKSYLLSQFYEQEPFSSFPKNLTCRKAFIHSSSQLFYEDCKDEPSLSEKQTKNMTTLNTSRSIHRSMAVSFILFLLGEALFHFQAPTGTIKQNLFTSNTIKISCPSRVRGQKKIPYYKREHGPSA